MKHFVAALLVLFATPCFASVGKISSPDIEKGVVEIEYTGTRYGDDGKKYDNRQAHVFELEYGFADRLMVGIEGEVSRESTEGNEFKAYGIEGQYLLTRQGEYWLTSAAKAEFSRAIHADDADEIKTKLLATYKTGPATFTANIGLSRELGSNRESGLGISSAWQARYSLNKHFNPGMEWQADHGQTYDLGRDGGHYLGPILRGDLTENLQYTVGYYWGLSHDTADDAARLQLSYGVPF